MDADVFTGILVSEQGALSLEEMVAACGAEVERIVELVEVGVLSPEGTDEKAWRFGAPDLLRARRLSRLERDFGASAEAAAVILDLLDEIERLRACLIRAGVDNGVNDSGRMSNRPEFNCNRTPMSTNPTLIRPPLLWAALAAALLLL